ncbi:uncharacterized protein LOC111910697 isoform X2 [Lactuca sativa]|uniref:uncharacterized protein LOC111910697 isoform X2 n=1 Tax=Lactuca sativa TaxID=4236 RepID=UPI000CD7EB14|nr:uncharacterized protein LOC111910697 isoform X2 [Lactuca sativa]
MLLRLQSYSVAGNRFPSPPGGAIPTRLFLFSIYSGDFLLQQGKSGGKKTVRFGWFFLLNVQVVSWKPYYCQGLEQY